MEALLKSFVHKVHAHVTSNEEDTNSTAAVQYLVPVLLSETTVEVKMQTVRTLGHICRDTTHIEEFKLHRGIEGVLHFMMQVPLDGLAPDVLKSCCTLMLMGDVGDALRGVASTATPVLLDWFARMPPSPVHHFHALLLLLCSDRVTLCELRRHNPLRRMADYLEHFDAAVCDDVEEVHQGLLVITCLAAGSQAVSRRAWQKVALPLFEAWARHVVAGTVPVPSDPLLSVLRNFVSRLPEEVDLQLGEESPLVEALTREIKAGGDLESVLGVLLNDSLATQLLSQESFVSALCMRVSIRFKSLTPSDRALALDYLIIAAARCEAGVPLDTIDWLYARVTDPGSLRRRATLYAVAAPTEELVMRFKRLLADNRTAAGDDDKLDALLCDHFDVLQQTPSLFFHTRVMVRGSPSHELFHCIEDLIGRSPLGDTWIDRKLRDFLREEVEEVRRDCEPCWGTLAYCEHIERTFLFPESRSRQAALPSAQEYASVCPITLEPMHCPVVASDGVTYELHAIMRHVLLTPNAKSPITREELLLDFVFNRSLQRAESQMRKLLLRMDHRK